jgi:hypothetical protein
VAVLAKFALTVAAIETCLSVLVRRHEKRSTPLSRDAREGGHDDKVRGLNRSPDLSGWGRYLNV